MLQSSCFSSAVSSIGNGLLGTDLFADRGPAALPLSFAQERLWLLDQIDRSNATYNLPCAVRLAGAPDIPALLRAVEAVVHRHEALRTRFEAIAGEPRQVIEPPLPVPLPVVDLAGTSEAEALRLATSEAARPFDLTRSPLLRACLLRRSAEADASSAEATALLTTRPRAVLLRRHRGVHLILF